MLTCPAVTVIFGFSHQCKKKTKLSRELSKKHQVKIDSMDKRSSVTHGYVLDIVVL